MSSKVPKVVAAICANFGGWVVGSAADPKNTSPRDYDVVVPVTRWPEIAPFIPRDAKVNTLGGFKFKSDGKELDVWCGELSWIMSQQPRTKWVWNPHLGIRFKRVP